ncbi:unnamed protein product [Urochloa humidicola]
MNCTWSRVSARWRPLGRVDRGVEVRNATAQFNSARAGPGFPTCRGRRMQSSPGVRLPFARAPVCWCRLGFFSGGFPCMMVWFGTLLLRVAPDYTLRVKPIMVFGDTEERKTFILSVLIRYGVH